MPGAEPDPLLLPETAAQILRLTGECELLREELARLFCERDELVHVTGPSLETDYQLQIGSMELEVRQRELAVSRLRRRIELLQLALGRGLVPDEALIEATLDAALATWQAEVSARARAVQEAEQRLQTVLDGEDTETLRRLYRRLALRLHPEVNPNLGNGARTLWQRVGQAYRHADLHELRALSLLVDHLNDAVAMPAGPDLPLQLRARRDELGAAVQRVTQELGAIRVLPPHSLADHLADPEWVASRQTELQTRLERLAGDEELLDRVLTEVRTWGHDEPLPSLN